MIKYIIVSVLILGVMAELHPEAKLDFADYCTYFGYPVEEHII